MTAEPNATWMDRLSVRARWILLLEILCCPLAGAVITGLLGSHYVLPHDPLYFARFLALELLSWCVVFFVAFRISGITRSQLRLETRHPLRAVGFGIVWFVVLRIGVGLILWGVMLSIDPRSLWESSERMSSFFDSRDIPRHPGFTCIAFGLVSLLAGFTEELWRAGMLAGLTCFFPQIAKKGFAAVAAITGVAVLFGLGHLYQGWFGVVNGALLGFFLGLVLVYRNSYWEAAIAHALFDALAFGVAILMAMNPQILGAFIIYNAYQGDLPKLEHYVSMGADVNYATRADSDWYGVTALDYAARRPNPGIVRFLLDSGADPNLQDSHGQTALIAAAEQNRVENVKLLLARGAGLNGRDKKGFTALRTAAEYNRVEVAHLLIAAGADRTLPDNDGMTPLEAAQKWRYADMIKLLQDGKPAGP